MIIDLLAGTVLALVIAVLTIVKKALTWSAVMTASGMLIFISCMSGFLNAVFLVGMYMSVFVVDAAFGKKMEFATKEIHEKGGTRSYKQILANGSAGCICILLYKVWNEPAFLIGYYASIYEVMADSIASDVGVLSKQPPRDICTWKVVARGISGGVSVLGLVASGMACICAGLITGMAVSLKITLILLIILAPYAGMLVDSVIGSLVQVKLVCPVCGIRTEKAYHCGEKTVITGGYKKISNSMVNFLCTVFAAVTGSLFAMLI